MVIGQLEMNVCHADLLNKHIITNTNINLIIITQVLTIMYDIYPILQGEQNTFTLCPRQECYMCFKVEYHEKQ